MNKSIFTALALLCLLAQNSNADEKLNRFLGLSTSRPTATWMGVKQVYPDYNGRLESSPDAELKRRYSSLESASYSCKDAGHQDRVQAAYDDTFQPRFTQKFSMKNILVMEFRKATENDTEKYETEDDYDFDMDNTYVITHARRLEYYGDDWLKYRCEDRTPFLARYNPETNEFTYLNTKKVPLRIEFDEATIYYR